MATTVEVLLRTNGGPGGKGNGPNTKNTDTNKNTPDTPILKQIFGGLNKFVKGKLGLNFGISSLLKQSQIFTSTIGVIFQLLGALVDVMIAPLLPLIVPLIRQFGEFIPYMSGWAERNIAPKIDAIIRWVNDFRSVWDGSWNMLWGDEGIGGLWDKLSDWFKNTALPFIGTSLINIVSELINWWRVTGFPFIDSTIQAVKDWLTDTAFPFISKWWKTDALPAIIDWWENTGKPFIVSTIPSLIADILHAPIGWVGDMLLDAVKWIWEKISPASFARNAIAPVRRLFGIPDTVDQTQVTSMYQDWNESPFRKQLRQQGMMPTAVDMGLTSAALSSRASTVMEQNDAANIGPTTVIINGRNKQEQTVVDHKNQRDQDTLLEVYVDDI